jgi:CMP-N,N'-diacetyllegionaminic acid synthase
MQVLGLIPARGGSKGIPGKNLATAGGRSLLAWAVDAAAGLDRVVVSTDAPEIAAAAEALGVEALSRPAELAADDVPMLDVVLHALEALGPADIVVLLQPTSPLRRNEHVRAALDLLEQTGADGVVSVVSIPHRYLPDSAVALDGDRVVPLAPDAPTLRQQKQVLYARNGPAVLAVRGAGLTERGLYGGDLRGYLMDDRSSLDVDGPFELELADLLLQPPHSR